jgi:hypothetical protein
VKVRQGQGQAAVGGTELCVRSVRGGAIQPRATKRRIKLAPVTCVLGLSCVWCVRHAHHCDVHSSRMRTQKSRRTPAGCSVAHAWETSLAALLLPALPLVR